MSVPRPHPQIMPSDSRAARSDRAFTLIELLAVLAIIGFLTVVALPQLKSSRKSNVMVDAGLQLVDDIALARRRAISGRTTVHMVFIATNIAGQNAMKVSAWRRRIKKSRSVWRVAPTPATPCLPSAVWATSRASLTFATSRTGDRCPKA